MNARRKMLLVALVVAPLVGIGAACTFPDVSFAPAGGAEGGKIDGPVGEGGPGTGETGAVGANEDVDPTGAMMDATTAPETGQRIEAGPDGCCDCDNDGFKPDSGTCANLPSQDCDDLNPFVFPTHGFDQGKTWDSPHTPDFDWNCDGVRTKQYDYNQKCNDPNNCNGKSGFNDDPNCGETVVFNTCQYNPGVLGVALASCKVGSTVMATQGCK